VGLERSGRTRCGVDSVRYEDCERHSSWAKRPDGLVLMCGVLRARRFTCNMPRNRKKHVKVLRLEGAGMVWVKTRVQKMLAKRIARRKKVTRTAGDLEERGGTSSRVELQDCRFEISRISGRAAAFSKVMETEAPFRTLLTSAGLKQAMHIPPLWRTLG
jgi:hypothetical protein